MARRALELGEVGEVETTPQVKVDGRWVATDRTRTAQRHRARAYFRGNDGVRREASATAPTKRDAVRRLESIVDERLRGAEQDDIRPSTPIVRAGAIWLKQIERLDSGLSKRTVDDYRAAFGRCVDAPGSTIRGLTLSQANDPQRIRSFLQTIADSRGTGAAKMCRSVLSGILQFAVDNGTLTTNATRQVRTVRSQVVKLGRRDHDRAYTRAERDSVIAYADALIPTSDEEIALMRVNPRSIRKHIATADLIAIMAGTGARIDEVRSLRWSDVDLDLAVCAIRGTKSEHSDRSVNLPHWLLARLAARADRVGGNGFVIASPAHLDTERRWDQSNSAAAVRTVLDGAGMTWAVPHTFRRTVASLLHEAGVPLVRISDQLGHSDPAFTARVYLGRDLGGSKADLASHL